ncbi:MULTISPECIES: anthranilate synthase component I [unclassified Bacillus (in: firmicutes)]|uniref:anthranilate synthase component I n=1 Tax=unclassified Bacillus (in: firmicutes) TaxID=185979 RepID=UPI0008EA8913|nr:MULTISPECIES: anthranilate synthase component I [unclassified Bacillus (in: firmicutes)]SFA91654.1 anthranilate synthase, component I [Bacillus sp. UNCCL13]SFQ85624.1 anthranilate synthase, component I [Bacillus sp. cl95]
MKNQLLKDFPLVFEIQGDHLTPITIMKKLSGEKKFLLESSHKHQENGRFSFIGADPTIELKSFGKEVEVIKEEGGRTTFIGNPLDITKEMLSHKRKLDCSVPFVGGAVGYVGYDIARHFENIGNLLNDPLNMPDVHLMFYEVIIAFDHLEQKILIIGNPLENSTLECIGKKMQMRKEQIEAPFTEPVGDESEKGKFVPYISKELFMERVKEAKKYIESGDLFQIVLSQRMKAKFKGDPFQFYRKLRIQNPSPYMFFVDFGEYTLAGSSPESLVKVEGRTVYTNPIAGTKKRGRDKQEDEFLENELRTDPKEIAEHRMLVDLGRNDLGKVCEFGTVSVNKYMQVEKFKHVMHIVSEAQGQLREGLNALDALASCLPAGTVAGAPKIRAMQLINDIEESKRGVYGGAIGYISADGNMDFALAIRTMLVKGDEAYIQAGAGIVYDSDPEQEYEETINKLRGFLGGNSC